MQRLWLIFLTNLPYSNKGDWLLKFIAKGIKKEISSSSRHASKISIKEDFDFAECRGLKGFLQILGIESLQ